MYNIRIFYLNQILTLNRGLIQSIAARGSGWFLRGMQMLAELGNQIMLFRNLSATDWSAKDAMRKLVLLD